MNTLTIGSIALIAGMLFIYWLSRIFRRDGASQQKDKDNNAINDYMEDNAEDWYDSNIGTDALGVRDNGAWGEGSPSDVKFRLVSDKGNDSSGHKAGDGVPKRKNRNRKMRDG